MLSIEVWAQKENNVWAFCSTRFTITDTDPGIGIDFNTVPPHIISTSIQASEGTASICDPLTGKLLFYSDGVNIWNADHIVMPNGSGILGGPKTSAQQGVVITPIYGHPQQFYLFTVDERETKTYKLRYSLVDMSLNGGKGDVVADKKNIQFGENMSERIAVASGKDGLWLVTHNRDTPTFYSYKIDCSYLHTTPIKSTIPGLPSFSDNDYYGLGPIIFSTDYNTIVTFEFGLCLLSFDTTTGIISNYRALGTTFPAEGLYCLEFSQDNSKIYVQGSNGYLSQYDLNLLPSLSAVKSSKYIVDSSAGYFRRGPDNKIYYFVNNKDIEMSVINNPNKAKSACDFEKDVAHLKHVPIFGLSLGNNTVYPKNGLSVITKKYDTTICFQSQYTVRAESGFSAYSWSDGTSSSSNTFTSSGTKWVYMTGIDCKMQIDTYKVTIVNFPKSLRDTFICGEEEIILDATSPNVAKYQWQDNSTNSTLTTKKSGIYWVKLSANQCEKTDTVIVSQRKLSVDLGKDQVLCEGTVLLLDPKIENANFFWQDGSTNPTYIANKAGLYSVKVVQGNCTTEDSIRISYEKCKNCILIPAAFTPNGDGRNDQFKPLTLCAVSKYSLLIVNRYGETVFSSNSANDSWNGKFNEQEQELGVYYYLLKVKFDYPNAQEEIYKGDISLIR